MIWKLLCHYVPVSALASWMLDCHLVWQFSVNKPKHFLALYCTSFRLELWHLKLHSEHLPSTVWWLQSWSLHLQSSIGRQVLCSAKCSLGATCCAVLVQTSLLLESFGANQQHSDEQGVKVFIKTSCSSYSLPFANILHVSKYCLTSHGFLQLHTMQQVKSILKSKER